MSIPCPTCGAALNVSLQAVDPPPFTDPVVVRDPVPIVATGFTTVRQVAEAMFGHDFTRADLERARRRLAEAVRDGRLDVRDQPTGGRPLAVFSIPAPSTG